MSDSDNDPPRHRRRRRHDSSSDDESMSKSTLPKQPIHNNDDMDDLPRPRKRTRHDSPPTTSDDDLNVPRRRHPRNTHDDISSPIRDHHNDKSHRSTHTKSIQQRHTQDDDKPPVGLQSAHTIDRHIEKEQRLEQERLQNIGTLGKHSETIYRDRDGKRITRQEFEEQRSRKKFQKKIQEQKEMFWGKGLKQVEEHLELVSDSTPNQTAQMLSKEQIDDLDPMVSFLEKIESKKTTSSSTTHQSNRPKYEGSFPPNRYGIRPGFRWDGVDRSNGFEKKFFEKQAEHEAREQIGYRMGASDA